MVSLCTVSTTIDLGTVTEGRSFHPRLPHLVSVEVEGDLDLVTSPLTSSRGSKFVETILVLEHS